VIVVRGGGGQTPRSNLFGERNVSTTSLDKHETERDEQTPGLIAHLCEVGEKEDGDCDSEQLLRWGQFLENRTNKEKKSDVKLLKALELCDDEMFDLEQLDEEQMVLSDEMVDSIKEARARGLMVDCSHVRKRGKTTKSHGGLFLWTEKKKAK
jgi:hypothetical protein